MSKIFETAQDILELAQTKFEETGLPQLGINLKVLSVTKGKQILKVSRANPTTQFLTKKDVILTIYEEAFDRLSDEYKEKLMEGAFSNVAYDSEKDKLLVEGEFSKEIFRMRKKYNNYTDIAEASFIVIEQIEEEEKQRKEEERLMKAEQKARKNKQV
jgi:hypothetical protein